jgi:molybdopterin/thiamine biosynthesis adenylyltransferase
MIVLAPKSIFTYKSTAQAEYPNARWQVMSFFSFRPQGLHSSLAHNNTASSGQQSSQVEASEMSEKVSHCIFKKNPQQAWIDSSCKNQGIPLHHDGSVAGSLRALDEFSNIHIPN